MRSMMPIAIAMTLLALPEGACAQYRNPLDLLMAGAYLDVEKQFSDVQSQFESGAINEFQLRDAYRPFYQVSQKYNDPLEAWVHGSPGSPYAHLVRGIFYRKLGENARGNTFLSETPAANLKVMAGFNVKAKYDLESALKIQPTLYMAVLHLLNISQFEGDRSAATRYLAMGNKLLPSNVMIRARYLISLEPRWGGSYPQMEAFIQRCADENVSPRVISLLRAIEDDDRGLMIELKSGWAQAWPQYEAALDLARAWPRDVRESYVGDAMRVCSIRGYETKDYCQ